MVKGGIGIWRNITWQTLRTVSFLRKGDFMETAFDLLNYIEPHSAIVQAISTVLLVLITGWYVYLMKKLIVTTKEAKRPYVFVELQGEGAFFLQIVIQNSGEMSAENVKFKII